MITLCLRVIATGGILLANVPVRAGDWKPLLNGKDLSGWTAVGGPQSSWTVKDGVLTCSGKGSGWLSTDQQYGDFVQARQVRSFAVRSSRWISNMPVPVVTASSQRPSGEQSCTSVESAFGGDPSVSGSLPPSAALR